MITIPVVTLKSARTRLALTYLSIIFVLAAGFSTIFYYQLVGEARRNLQGQRTLYQDFIFFATPERERTIQEAQLRLFKSELKKRLVLTNLVLLGTGALFSYYMAGRSLRPLKEALTAQSRFTSDAAHELRTPLTAMKAETEVALRGKNLTSKEARQVLSSNLEEINKLDTLTTALLRLARSAEQVDKSNWQDYKLADILYAARDRVSEKAKSRGISIRLPKNARAIVHGDPDQLTELFVTLFGNAVKYSHDKGSIVVKIASGEKIRVDVIDHGVGIADIDRPHIFERFYRADTARSREGAEGYGLGLSLAEAITTTHGGEIKVKSVYGKGSTFSVFLPKPE